MGTAAPVSRRPGGSWRTDVLALLVVGALCALAATAAHAVTKRTNPGPKEKCPAGLQVIQPVETGTYDLRYGTEAGSLSIVRRATSDGPLIDFTTDRPTHLVDVVLVVRGDDETRYDYRPAGVTSATGLHAGVNERTGKYHVPSYLCVETRLKPPPTVDVCPNIPGDQAEIPPGMIKDEAGNCVTPPTDVCPNIPGVQPTVPPGMIKDASGNCVTPPPPPPTDVCPNIPGVQETVPPGMVKDASGNCVTPPPPPVDVCPNIPGVQETVPPGMVKDASGNCVTPPSPPPSIDLAIAKDDSVDPVSAGRTVLYTITATNTSSVKATGVVVTDTVPAGLEILSVRANQGSCSTAGRTVTCRLGGLPAGSKAVVKILVRTSAPGVVTNFARVSGNEPDPQPGNNTTSENTRIVAPFQPPSADCDTVTVAGRRTVNVGVRTQLRIFVKANGRGMAGERIRVRGPGINLSARTNRRGIATVWVRAARPGVIAIAVVGEPTCGRRIGAVGGGQPDLTG
jgi:uncharacterized repeat protein (TIGR01451 family)